MSMAVQVILPDELVAKARQFVEEGWAADFDNLMADALRRYLESHEPELSESFIREDAKWGLDGRT